MNAVAELTYRHEKLTYTELRGHMFATIEDFEPHDDTFLDAYALKLSENAEFVTARNSDGEFSDSSHTTSI